MPINDDDAAAHGQGGPLKYWLAYKVWGIPGYGIVLAVLVFGLVAGHKI